MTKHSRFRDDWIKKNHFRNIVCRIGDNCWRSESGYRPGHGFCSGLRTQPLLPGRPFPAMASELTAWESMAVDYFICHIGCGSNMARIWRGYGADMAWVWGGW